MQFKGDSGVCTTPNFSGDKRVAQALCVTIASVTIALCVGYCVRVLNGRIECPFDRWTTDLGRLRISQLVFRAVGFGN